MKTRTKIDNGLLALTAKLFAATAILLMTVSAHATLYLGDAIPTSGDETGGYAVSTLAGQTPTAASITGGTGSWSGSSTSTQVARSGGLSYPTGSSLNSSGGNLATSNGSTSESSGGRYLSRNISNIPTNGIIYLSILVQMDNLSTVNGWSIGTEQCGAGFRKNNSVLTTRKMPTDGVFFGFTKTASGAKLIARIGGTDVDLVSDISAATPYHCMAKVQIGAGTAGAEIVSVSVNPPMPSEPTTWDDSVEVEFLSSGQTLSYYAVGGTYATAGYDIAYDEYSISSKYYSETFGDLPIVIFDLNKTGFDFTGFSSVAVSNNASYVDDNAPAVYVCYGTTEGDASTNSWDYAELVVDPAVVDTQYTKTLNAANLTSNTLYYCGLVATNSTAGLYSPLGTFLNGELSIVKTSDAQEAGLVPGVFTLTRPTGTDQGDLDITYTIGGTAVAGSNYVDNLTGMITIPAGQTNATITVTPLFDVQTTTDTTVILTLTTGAYIIAAPGTATMTIENADPPVDKNAWIASSAGNASVAANWSQGHVPNASDDILLDVYSIADMTWDVDGVNGLTNVVASWTQTSNYTGVVTFPITYSSASTTFTNFTVNGNVDIQAGSWTHTTHGHTSSQTYHLQAEIGGNFTLGAYADIDLYAKGRWTTGASAKCGAYGGNALDSAANVFNAFDNLMFPTASGVGCQSGTDSDNKKSSGGGSIWLTVDGTATLDGDINADGQISFSAGGSGGSILIDAANIVGSGSISARGNTGTKSDGCGSSSSGGRIALLAEQGMTFPTDNVVIRGTRDPWNGRGAAGTLFVQSATIPGAILVKNYVNVNNAATTPIPSTTDTDNWDSVRDITLEAQSSAHLELWRSLQMHSLTLDATSDLELAGQDITLNIMTVDSVEIPVGSYTADEFATEFGAGHVTDTLASGHVIVIGNAKGTLITIN
ncbi:MAG: hypothetical protein PF692_05675 [Kiritimatiellae bacterium]|jgi:hypothetical protein|nr:hypothetical protein [Kiritimatiellia bacterium]